MIEALTAGKLHGKPEQRTAKTGRPFVTAKLRAAVADGEPALFIRVTAFSESACTALLALDDGDACAVAGTAKPTAWTDRDGTARAGLDLIAAQVLTVYGLKHRREAVASTRADTGRIPAVPQQRRQPPAPPVDDFGAEGDDWLQGNAGADRG